MLNMTYFLFMNAFYVTFAVAFRVEFFLLPLPLTYSTHIALATFVFQRWTKRTHIFTAMTLRLVLSKSRGGGKIQIAIRTFHRLYEMEQNIKNKFFFSTHFKIFPHLTITHFHVLPSLCAHDLLTPNAFQMLLYNERTNTFHELSCNDTEDWQHAKSFFRKSSLSNRACTCSDLNISFHI